MFEYKIGFAAHADDLMYLFDVPIPIFFCDLEEFFTALAQVNFI